MTNSMYVWQESLKCISGGTIHSVVTVGKNAPSKPISLTNNRGTLVPMCSSNSSCTFVKSAIKNIKPEHKGMNS